MIDDANDSGTEAPQPEEARILGARRLAMPEGLERAGCVHPEAVIDLADPEALTMGKDRRPQGIDREVRRLQEAYPRYFGTTPAPRHGTPPGPRQPSAGALTSSRDPLPPRDASTERFLRTRIHYPG